MDAPWMLRFFFKRRRTGRPCSHVPLPTGTSIFRPSHQRCVTHKIRTHIHARGRFDTAHDNTNQKKTTSPAPYHEIIPQSLAKHTHKKNGCCPRHGDSNRQPNAQSHAHTFSQWYSIDNPGTTVTKVCAGGAKKFSTCTSDADCGSVPNACRMPETSSKKYMQDRMICCRQCVWDMKFPVGAPIQVWMRRICSYIHTYICIHTCSYTYAYTHTDIHTYA
jgi:hypothetical protein